MDIRDYANNRFDVSADVPSADYAAENAFMQAAVEEARIGIYNGDGGPFGSVVVKDGVIIGRGHNRVIADNDSTCHGEIAAIRDAEKNFHTYDLKGCEIYTTGEPCPMCLGACLWANIRKVYYGCSLEDNESIGFRDRKFDEFLGIKKEVRDYMIQTDREACLSLFDEYRSLDRVNY